MGRPHTEVIRDGESSPATGLGTLSIQLPLSAYEMIRAHAARAYPEECCGALMGHSADEDVGSIDHHERVVERVVELENRAVADRERRYLVPAVIVQELETQAHDAGLEVVGYYHSHPDGDAAPSQEDRAWAWPWYSYMIIPVSAPEIGAADDTPHEKARCWRLRDDREAFIEERIILMEES